MIFNKYIFLLFIFLIIFISPLQANNGKNIMSGKIVDGEGNPLPGANIYIHELHRGTISNEKGYYQLEDLNPGVYHIHVTFIGYEATSKTVKIDSPNEEVNFTLRESSLEMQEVLIEANPFKSGPLEQSMTIETIDRQALQRSSGGTLVTSMQNIPGINAINTGVGIAKPVIRGLSFNRVVVTDRGIKQEGQQWGSDHGLEIDQFEPERVEIIKGPASLVYGSDAIGGVINIKPAIIPEQGEFNGSFFTTYKTNNQLKATSTMLEGNKGGKVFRARFSTQDFNDYVVPADEFNYLSYVYPIYNNRLKNTAGRERNFSLMGGLSGDRGYSTVTVSNFHQQAGLFSGAIGLPGEYNPAPDGSYSNIDFPRQVINHLKVISNTNLQFGSDWLEMDIGFQQNRRREESFPHAHGRAPSPQGNLALQLILNTFSGNINYHQNLQEHIKSVYGIQFQRQTNSKGGFEHLLPAYSSGNIGIYNHHEITMGNQVTMSGGLRFDYGQIDVNRFTEPDYVTEEVNGTITRNLDFRREFINFSGAAGLSWYPGSEFNLKLNMGSSFRMPSAAELSINGVHHGTFRHEVGDSTLQSERGYQLDLNLTYKKRNFILGLTPYFNYFTNYIYLGPSGSFYVQDVDGKKYALPESGQVYKYFQDDAIFTGGEAFAEYHLWRELHLKVAGEYVYNYNLDKHLPLPFTPPLSVLGEIMYEKDFKNKKVNNFYLGLDVKYFAAQNRVDRNEKPTPGYTLTNFMSGVSFNIWQQPVELGFSIQNLFNISYLNHLSRYRLLNIPEQGRNIIFSLEVPFGW